MCGGAGPYWEVFIPLCQQKLDNLLRLRQCAAQISQQGLFWPEFEPSLPCSSGHRATQQRWRHEARLLCFECISCRFSADVVFSAAAGTERAAHQY